ncbi:MAG: GIY-YIG nuclease family protein [Candidatus Aenigmarchaeota archaeon]|nr:GIY-YIG nuclease family protein [Candidatus Aenigmarchaeota archaeon]
MKGSYVLLIKLGKAKGIRIGRLGTLPFRPGFYAYVGSALNGLEARIARHLGSRKRLFWHIDYLLQEAEVAEVFRIESGERLECSISKSLSQRLEPVPGFGSSDCGCGSHLFYSGEKGFIKNRILDAMPGLA